MNILNNPREDGHSSSQIYNLPFCPDDGDFVKYLDGVLSHFYFLARSFIHSLSRGASLSWMGPHFIYLLGFIIIQRGGGGDREKSIRGS